jgi:exo-beta-1,3-glucanase (GH17 family)
LGVSYGTVANDLPDPSSVVKLLGDNGITMVRIYDANSNVLSSLANTGIKVMVMVRNENLADAASSSDYALQWVKSNVAAYYPATQIHGVAVGNEVFNTKPDQNLNLVPAMTNIQKALAQLNLADAIKVTTPIAFNAVAVSWPPSSGAFSDDIAQPVMKPMLQFLQQTGSYLSVNYYPYLTYMAQPDTFNLDYVLGNPNNPGVVDPDTQLKYSSLLDAQRDATYYAMDKLLLDAQRDATYYAMDKLGASSLAVHHTEHGAPSGGKLGGGGGHRRLLQAGGVATIANAQTYINNLMNRVLSGNTGTPYRPNADMNVYIFALFNEDQKGTGADDVEQHFGLFYPNMQKVYEFDFRGTVTPPPTPPTPATPQSWCVANAAVGDARLQAALDYACGHGADCSAIQSGGSCFQPDTKVAHATYAFNSYYQANGRTPSSCDFNGAASIVYQAPGTVIKSVAPKSHFT